MTTLKTINWGILGCGTIAAQRFIPSLRKVAGANLVAVASKTPGKAKAFAEKNAVPNSYDTYEDLLSRADIDVVYVATTHNLHYECVLLALRYGKHVLCEKPFTVNAREAKELILLSRSKNLFMMEAMWTRFLPSTVQTRQWIDEGKIGRILQLRANFGFRTEVTPEHRLMNLSLAGGALLDAGIYPLSFSSMLMKESPSEIHAVASIGVTGVDEQSAYLLKFADGRVSLLSSAVAIDLNNRADIIGTEGRISIPPGFHKSARTELYRNGEEPVIREFSPVEQDGFKYEIEEVVSCLRSGKTESAVMGLDETVAIMETIDEIKKQLGLVYGNDE